MKKATKILAGGGLALMFGLGTLFGVLVAPMNSTHATTSANATTETALTPEAQAKAELDANIINSGSKGLGIEIFHHYFISFFELLDLLEDLVVEDLEFAFLASPLALKALI